MLKKYIDIHMKSDLSNRPRIKCDVLVGNLLEEILNKSLSSCLAVTEGISFQGIEVCLSSA